MFSGGIYAIETKYNRTEKTWHVHAHVLLDATFALPAKEERVNFAGRNMPAFTFIKLSLEYDWSRLWCKPPKPAKGKPEPKADFAWINPRKNARQYVIDGARLDFEEWVRGCFDNALLEYRNREWVPIRGLSEAETEDRHAWNVRNRRVLFIKPVDDRKRAAKEVLKYITKSSDFCDLAECVKAFYEASKGARMVQTFGTWYGVNFDADFDTRHMEDWKNPKCECGLNHWEPMGTFSLRDVEMETDGRWFLKRAFDHNSAGTVPRPTIRALERRAEEGDSQQWQSR
jgi:hypothetical protein